VVRGPPRSSDIVTIRVRLNPETRNLIGERELSLMKPKAEEKLEALDFRPGRDVAKDNL